MIWAVVLAAGKSERMGRPKMLLPFGRKKLIEKVVASVMKSRVDGILVVLGACRGDIERVLQPYPVKPIFNPDFNMGMLSSIQAGVKAVPRGARAVLVFLGDQPSTLASVADRLISEYEHTGKGIVLPVHGGRRGHPVLIDMKYKREILALDPGIGLRQLMLNRPDDVLEILVRTPGILTDIDRPEDLKRVKRGRPKLCR